MPDLMPIERIPDWEERLARQDAFWDCEILDRPVVVMSTYRENPHYPPPAEKDWDSLKERWWDTEYVVEGALHRTMNARYFGDALPGAHPKLGPEVFSCLYGLEMEYGERTGWSIPALEDWSEADELQLSRDNPYWKKLVEMTEALLEAGENKFYTGVTDWHPGGDALAAFRDPQRLAVDLLEHPEEVKELLNRVTDDFFEVYDAFCDRVVESGQAVTTWLGVVSTRRWYVPSNDFSCMVSNEMFEEFFLPGLARECAHLEASIYHLDGPGALHHLDSLLSLDDLNAIQWVYGQGNGRASDWLDVYHRCQNAGKGLQIRLDLDELDLFISELHPEGVWLSVGVSDEAEAEAVLDAVKKWT
jgi:hypothetical protein